MKHKHLQKKIAISLLSALLCSSAMASDNQQSLDELRDTLNGVLQALVQKGLLTKEQAQDIVANAQAKAQAEAEVRARDKAAQDEKEKDAVRVTYVPQIVRDEISKQVAQDVTPAVTQNVIDQAKKDRWGVPGALPEWASAFKFYGDVRLRVETAQYDKNNIENSYPNFDAINSAGGISRAGINANLNVSENRERLVGRMRLGANVDLGGSFKADLRLVTGNARSPVSTNQTLGNFGGRWTVNVDKAAILYNPVSANKTQELDARFGLFSNPFVSSSELVWDNDLTFEGVALTYAYNIFGKASPGMERGLFLTLGAFPIQEIELSTKDKWLTAAQLGSLIPIGDQSRLRIAAGYFNYLNISGKRNTLDSTLLDYTAPRFLQKGNTVFDIRNDNDQTTNLFALASKYQLAVATMSLDIPVSTRNHFMLNGEYVKNIGWKESEVLAKTGLAVPPKTTGYDVSLSLGRTAHAFGDWRGFIGYRYVERDAVLDAFTDSDFHLGGTDTKGYQFGFDLGLSKGSWLRLRYLSANQIDGPPLGIDVFQLDINGQF